MNTRLVMATVAVSIGCRQSQPMAIEVPRRADRTVFADSALHDKLCQPIRPGEDWRRVCVPRDQAQRVP